MPDDAQCNQRDDDRQTSEYHCGTGGSDGATCCFGTVVGKGELMPEPGHDEQRVVDRHSQTDHDRQRRSHRTEIHESGGNRDSEAADSDTDDRGEERKPRGHKRTERDGQNDCGNGDTDQLGDTTGHLRFLSSRTTDLDVESLGPDRHRLRS